MKNSLGDVTAVAAPTAEQRFSGGAKAELQRQREAVALRLHDSVLQSLAAISIHLKIAQNLLNDDPKTAAQYLARIDSVLSAEQQSLRRFVGELKGVQAGARLDKASSLAVLKKLVKWLEYQWNVKVEFVAERGAASLPTHVLGELLFMLQESVSNAVRHGHASLVEIHLSRAADALVVRIVDNGSGFPSDKGSIALHASDAVPAMLKTRIDALGGSLAIRSSASGVRLEIRLPLAPR